MKRAWLGAIALAVDGNGTATPPEPTTSAPASAPVATPTTSGAGRVVDAKFASAALGVTKHVTIYLPASYEAQAARRYPVFYYLHGLGGDETNWTRGGKLAETADALALEAIVVMPDGDDSFYADAVTAADYDACKRTGAGLLDPSRNKAKTCVRARKYETYLAQDLVGWIDQTYRTIATREGRGIAGLSMGGFGALSIALRNPDRFAAAASHSGVVAPLYDGPFPYARGQVKLLQDTAKVFGGKLGPVGDWMRSIFGTDIAGWQAHDPSHLVTKLGPNAPKLYLDCGTEDELGLQTHTMYLHDLLVERGIEHEYWLGPGGHDFRLWSTRLPNSLQFLRKSTTPAADTAH
jgi:S-formylglutathione hydrolase